MLLEQFYTKAPELYRYFQINNNNDNISQEPLVRKYSDTDSYQNDETVNNNAIKNKNNDDDNPY